MSTNGHLTGDADSWVVGEIARLDGVDEELRDTVASLSAKMSHAVRAATEAANQSLETSKALVGLEAKLHLHLASMDDKLASHTGEILKLIAGDHGQDRRIETFERHARETTELAIKSITMQADKAGRGLGRKVTVPVSGIALVTAAVQWLVAHWDVVSKHLH